MVKYTAELRPHRTEFKYASIVFDLKTDTYTVWSFQLIYQDKFFQKSLPLATLIKFKVQQ